jgi:hypothetical protein
MDAGTAFTSLRRARALAVVGAAAAALAVAGTAAAQPVQPVDKNGKKSCAIKTTFGTIWIEHGATMIDEYGRQMKCDDGGWVQVTRRA